MRRCVQVIYSGRVQGVGFRYSVRALACGFEVTGYVRNLPDGRVEVVAQGEEAEVRSFLEAIETSHLAGHIRGRTETWLPVSEQYRGFEIRF